MTEKKALFSARVIVACHIGIVIILILSALGLTGCVTCGDVIHFIATGQPEPPPKSKKEYNKQDIERWEAVIEELLIAIIIENESEKMYSDKHDKIDSEVAEIIRKAEFIVKKGE